MRDISEVSKFTSNETFLSIKCLIIVFYIRFIFITTFLSELAETFLSLRTCLNGREIRWKK